MAVTIAAVAGMAFGAEGNFFRPQPDGIQYDCMAVPLAYPVYKQDEVTRAAQDHSNLSLYPTRMPRGWTPMGTTEVTSIFQATASAMAGRPSDTQPAVVVCRPLGTKEAPPAKPVLRVMTPTEQPAVDPSFFKSEE
ncbi:MAG: hypothetical protein V4850_33025 [Myxococcota bacterium]